MPFSVFAALSLTHSPCEVTSAFHFCMTRHVCKITTILSPSVVLVACNHVDGLLPSSHFWSFNFARLLHPFQYFLNLHLLYPPSLASNLQVPQLSCFSKPSYMPCFSLLPHNFLFAVIHAPSRKDTSRLSQYPLHRLIFYTLHSNQWFHYVSLLDELRPVSSANTFCITTPLHYLSILALTLLFLSLIWYL